MATEHSRRDFLRIAGGTAVGAGALLTSTSSGAPARNASHPSVPGGSGAAPWAVSPPGTVTTASWTADRAVRPMPGSHGVLGSAENVTLTTDTYVMRAALVPGQRYRVRSLIYGDSATVDHAGEILFVGAAGGQGLSTSKIDETSYLLLRSGPGLFRTDRVITVNRPVTQLGLRHVRKPGRAVVKTLTIERVDQARPTDCLLSFDVEALHGRAAGPHWIDSLVWGKVDGGEYGIRRICDILDQYSVKASFLIEFASCSYEGERPLREIIDFLGSRGHEIQMHLHSDQLLEFWGLRPRKASMTLNRLSYEMSRRVLDFAATKFEQFVGGRPRVFRSGGLDINENLVNAAAALGIEALSNVREDAAGDPAVKGDPVDAWEPFVWDNGVLELPIDYDYD
ncbi:MAG: polysaccharide deacetylase family protein, partial [Betaproteobacteria bacterium]